jgi:hypothetical protein
MAEMTCPKCGKQYYGIGCPYCDYPPVPPNKALARRRFLFGLVFIAIGLCIVVSYFLDPKSHWSAYLAAGIVFSLGGIHMVLVQRLYDENSRASALAGGLLLALFSYLSFVGAFSARAHWTTFPLIPPEWSHGLARTLSGFFGLLMAAFALRSFYLVIKPKGKK